MAEPGPGPADREQRIAVPARGPVLAILLAGAFAEAGTAAMLGTLAENPPGRSAAAALGVAGCVAITAGTGFIFYGSAPRPAGDVQTRWMGATVARFMAVPALCLSIYFLLPAGGQFAVLATCGAYLACLAAETATVVRAVHRSIDPPRP